jgi:hypothetical protein
LFSFIRLAFRARQISLAMTVGLTCPIAPLFGGAFIFSRRPFKDLHLVAKMLHIRRASIRLGNRLKWLPFKGNDGFHEWRFAC